MKPDILFRISSERIILIGAAKETLKGEESVQIIHKEKEARADLLGRHK